MLTSTMVRSAELWLKMSASSLAWERRPALRRRPKIWSKASHSYKIYSNFRIVIDGIPILRHKKQEIEVLLKYFYERATF